MSGKHNLKHIENASPKIGRRHLLGGLALGAAISITAPEDVWAGSKDELDWLIDESLEIDKEMKAASDAWDQIFFRPDRPSVTITMRGIAGGRYADDYRCDEPLMADRDIVDFFAPYFRFGARSASEQNIHFQNRAEARALLENRKNAETAWNASSGLDDADRVLDAVTIRSLEIDKKIMGFPCRDFSAVARKVAYITSRESISFCIDEWLLDVIRTTGGLPALPAAA